MAIPQSDSAPDPRRVATCRVRKPEHINQHAQRQPAEPSNVGITAIHRAAMHPQGRDMSRPQTRTHQPTCSKATSGPPNVGITTIHGTAMHPQGRDMPRPQTRTHQPTCAKATSGTVPRWHHHHPSRRDAPVGTRHVASANPPAQIRHPATVPPKRNPIFPNRVCAGWHPVSG